MRASSATSKQDRRSVLVATATVDQGGSPVELLVADRYGRVRQHRRLTIASRQPTTPDGAERGAAAMRDGRVPPADSLTPAAGAPDTGAAPEPSANVSRPSVPAVQRHHARRSPDG